MTAKSLKHLFQSGIGDGADATLVQPGDWNDDHVFWLGYRAVTGTTDTIAHADHLLLITYSNASGVAVDLPAPTGGNMPLGWTVKLRNINTGLVTVTGSSGATINGQASIVLQQYETLELRSIGTSAYIGIVYLAEGTEPIGTHGYSHKGLTGTVVNNTTWNFAAAAVVLTNAAGYSVLRTNVGATANDVTTSGPAAGGRDQAGAFTAGSWVHFYFIWNGATLSTISSAMPPPTGPTMPTGYTYWAYIGAIYFKANSTLTVGCIVGAWYIYAAQLSVLAAGTATTETSVDVSGAVPPNAVAFELMAFMASSSGATAYVLDGEISWRSGTVFSIVEMYTSNTEAMASQGTFIIPNVSQTIYYRLSSSTATPVLSCLVAGYSMPNGAT